MIIGVSKILNNCTTNKPATNIEEGMEAPTNLEQEINHQITNQPTEMLIPGNPFEKFNFKLIICMRCFLT